jgi:hypothetical protein
LYIDRPVKLDRFSSDFQKVFLGILESASIRSAKSGMLREMEWRSRSMTGDFGQFLKVGPELEKRESMEIVNTVRDLAAVLVFLGVAMTPRAILTYFTLREKE